MSQTNNRPKPAFLDDGFQLLLFGGKGGVGKTTCATAAALRLSGLFPQRSFLLVSTDPAHSLTDSLAGCPTPENLTVLELDAAACLKDFVNRKGEKLRQIAARGTFLDNEDISRFLDLSLPGLDELMSFLEISRWLQESRYDSVLVDTAPTGHTLRLLQMPELLRQWIGALDSLLEKHRYMRGVFGRSRDADELDLFLEELLGSVHRMEHLLQDALHCRFIPVMLAEPLSMLETVSMVQQLDSLHLPVTDVLVNRIHPGGQCRVCEDIHDRQCRELAGWSSHPVLSRCVFWGLPLHTTEVRGAPGLQEFWDNITRLSPVPPVRCRPHDRLEPKVDGAIAAPSPDAVFLLFGGKGGVGKTTLACATALWMAGEYRQKRVLLFSTDPAHSLSDCLDLPVGPEPTGVIPGLTAIEIDAEAEFRILKEEYADDLQDLLAGISNFDLTFDRQVMEKLLDLAPPGLDEIMALSKVLEFLADGSYDVFVVDSAATGHLLRWLELPDLITRWLRVFFDVLLKYRQILHFPNSSRRLVEISRNLKRLQKIWTDPLRARVYAVSILTQMALEETRDLVAACERSGIYVPAIFLNLATPAGDCRFCSAICRHESLVRKNYEQAFPGKAQAVIHQGGELRGIARLEELAQALYLGAGREAACHAS
jgi:arsenite/tail-anchored protein-transporting ATPase